MNAEQTFLVVALAVASVMSFTIAGLAWRRRPLPGQIVFSFLVFAVGIWTLGYLFELIIPDQDAKLFWVNFQYIGIATVPPLWFLFAYLQTGRDRRILRPVFLTLLFSDALVTILLSWTNPLHGLMRSGIQAAQGPFNVLTYDYGLWFWIHAALGYLFLLAATILLIHGSVHSQRILRIQRLLLIGSALLPWIGNVLYLSGTFRHFDPSPLAFSLSAIFIIMGVLRFRLMDLAPIARDAVLESLDDGLLVLDNQQRVIDANPAASRFLSQPRHALIGRDARLLLAPWPALLSLLDAERAQESLQVQMGDAWMDVRLESVQDERLRQMGRMMILRNVTLLHETENRLRGLNEDLERRVQQRTAELSRELENRRMAEQALLSSQERYALAARGANDGLWDWDIRTGSVYYSARWCEIFEVNQAEEMVGTPQEWFTRIHPDDQERVRRELDSHLRGDTPDLRSQHRILTSGGGEKWVLVRGQAILNGSRTPARMAGSFSDITQQKKAEDQLVFNAMHDALTGLPNRALFLDRLAHAIERVRRNSAYQFAVLYVDFDRFKLINDSLGHNFGDLLLVASSQRMAAAVRAVDTVARLGGDEFVILLDGVGGPEDAVRVAERLQRDFGMVFKLEGYQVYNTAAIGIVLSQPDYTRAEEILRDADIAMYHAKLKGRARYSIFDTSMRERVHSRLEIETELRYALERGELSLHYQPLVDLRTGAVHGFEALLRWTRPGRGEVPPADFIPVAEDTGLILKIGHWVLRQACKQMAAWRGLYPGTDISISVNVSPRQLAQGIFAEEVEAILQETGIPATALRLELTESALLEENDIVGSALARLRDLGVSLHLDDFGTGYSSLSYLHRYKVDALKIDRSFIHSIGPGSVAQDIVRTILSLARELNLEVYAEGVETPEQLEFLQSLRCEFGQGFWFGRPVDAAAAGALLRERSREI